MYIKKRRSAFNSIFYCEALDIHLCTEYIHVNLKLYSASTSERIRFCIEMFRWFDKKVQCGAIYNVRI